MTLVEWWNVETVKFEDKSEYNLDDYMCSEIQPLWL